MATRAGSNSHHSWRSTAGARPLLQRHAKSLLRTIECERRWEVQGGSHNIWAESHSRSSDMDLDEHRCHRQYLVRRSRPTRSGGGHAEPGPASS